MSTQKGCRACGSHRLETVLDLGRVPLANALRTEAELDLPEETFPLVACLCGACSLVQITENVPPERLFREYAYFSSYSQTMLRHAEALSARVREERQLGPRSLVVEVASNDGYLLSHYARAGVRVLGVEPARNVAEVAEAQHGIRTITEFFCEPLAERMREAEGPADVIHASNVLAHVPDAAGFLRGVARLLADDGVAVIEVPHVLELVDRLEFDTIYHEHLAYFSLTALVPLLAQSGLVVAAVERVSVHGGSLRLFAKREGHGTHGLSVTAMLAEEAAWGVSDIATYRRLGARVRALRKSLGAALRRVRASGGVVAAYGASAKGATLLSTLGLDHRTLAFVVDRSPHKQGRYMPGTRLRIESTAALSSRKPDAVLLLAWNLTDESAEQEAAYLRAGGRMIVPIPEVRVIGRSRSERPRAVVDARP